MKAAKNSPLCLSSAMMILEGMGSKKEEVFSRLGVRTLRVGSYVDRSSLKFIDECVYGVVSELGTEA
ncbi:MAG: hypothetical protein II954_10705 [Synergistaceae bacterium]|nr:hypothetical protein [Synergistaceae bacterium]